MHLLALSVSCLIFLAAAPAAPAEDSAPIIEHGPRNTKMVALTFDACPTSKEDEYDQGVIDVLLREKVHATLFMSGRWVEKNGEAAKFLASQPQFEIGNHAYWHPHLLTKDDDRVLRELRSTQAIIRKVTGERPRYFRPPFGEVDERVAALVQKAGLVTVQYDIASGDPDPGLSAERIARAVVAGARGGSIVVFHMNRNGVRTAEVLPEVIRGLRQKGYEFATVGEMLKKADGEKPGDRKKGRGKEPGRTSTGRPVPDVRQSIVCH